MAFVAWVTEDEADTYFAARHGASEYWVSGTDKAGALKIAQQDLVDAGLWNFPDVDGSVPADDAMKEAVYEQALFHLRFGEDVELRNSLRSTGVTAAGVLEEQYRGDSEIVIAPRARAKLTAYLVSGLNTFEWCR